MKAKEAYGYNSVAFTLHKDRKDLKGTEIRSSSEETLLQNELNHGDIVYIEGNEGSTLLPAEDPVTFVTSASTLGKRKDSDGDLPLPPSKRSPPTTAIGVSVPVNVTVEEDEVDTILWAKDGSIQRPRTSLCGHGANGRCLHCLPLEPYNEEYLKERNIKHLSFHSYVRKLIGEFDK